MTATVDAIVSYKCLSDLISFLGGGGRGILKSDRVLCRFGSLLIELPLINPHKNVKVPPPPPHLKCDFVGTLRLIVTTEKYWNNGYKIGTAWLTSILGL